MILAAALAWQVGLAACVPLLVRRFDRNAGYPLAAATSPGRHCCSAGCR